jgi:hypothetical protein
MGSIGVALSDADLGEQIFGCGDGPAAFNATATKKGYTAQSAYPLYQFSSAEIDYEFQRGGNEILRILAY